MDTNIFNLLPITWEALAAIATFFAVIVAVGIAIFQHRHDKKQEMLTRLVVLKNELDDYLRFMPSTHHFNSFRNIDDFRKDAPLIYSRIPKKFRDQIDDIYTRSFRVQLLRNQIHEKLKELIQTGFKNKINSQQFSVSNQAIPSADELMQTYYLFHVGGSPDSVTLVHLLMGGMALSEYIEEKMRNPFLPNWIISNEFGFAPNLTKLNRVQFEEILQSIRAQFEKENLIKQCVTEYTALHKMCKSLLEKLNIWLHSQ